jgi:hypothetical protein
LSARVFHDQTFKTFLNRLSSLPHAFDGGFEVVSLPWVEIN